jgi:pimeloyl-ACP methyl ester carboxylesterase
MSKVLPHTWLAKAIPFRKLTWRACIVALIIGGVLYILDSFEVLKPTRILTPQVLVPSINTRGHFRNGLINPGHNAYDYTIVGDIPGLVPGTAPPDDLVIVIHGFNNSPKVAAGQFDLARMSLLSDNYSGAIVGFSWDADTELEPWSASGFHECRRNACGNGPKLARFVMEYKARCPNTRVHIIGYSIGSRLALETALALYSDRAFAATDTKIDSIFLVGAAVGNEEVRIDEKYGPAIESRVGILYNFYSTKDRVLGTLYPLKESNIALGITNIENPDLVPSNYVSVDVANELRVVDQAGAVSDQNLGTDHLNCLGIQNDQGALLDDGVMDVIADYIRETSANGAIPGQG